jgi:hypothetical protein
VHTNCSGSFSDLHIDALARRAADLNDDFADRPCLRIGPGLTRG